METIRSILPKRDRITIKQVFDLFLKVDEDSKRFKKMTGIYCPDMCGICCIEADVETTVIEMMPLAVELWENGEAEQWMEAIDKEERSGMCVFFKRDPAVLENGRCAVYEFRPLICRLFGFFTVKDKNGDYVYGGCKEIKKKYPKNYQKAIKLIAEGFHSLNVTDYSIRISSIGTELSREMFPINISAKRALEKIGFEIQKKQWQK